MPSENDIKTQPKKLYIINRVETEREIPKLKFNQVKKSNTILYVGRPLKFRHYL